MAQAGEIAERGVARAVGREGRVGAQHIYMGAIFLAPERGVAWVGLMMSAVLGVSNTDARERAVEMGMAVELTRVLRDLKKEGERNRVLLPLEDLIRFKYSEKQLMRGEVNERFGELMKFEVERARELYRVGAEGIRWVGGDGSRLAAATMGVLYSGLLRVMERRGFEVFSSEVKLSAGQRARRMVDAWRLARGGKARGWERR